MIFPLPGIQQTMKLRLPLREGEIMIYGLLMSIKAREQSILHSIQPLINIILPGLQMGKILPGFPHMRATPVSLQQTRILEQPLHNILAVATKRPGIQPGNISCQFYKHPTNLFSPAIMSSRRPINSHQCPYPVEWTVYPGAL
jgi:hypothetical protein